MKPAFSKLSIPLLTLCAIIAVLFYSKKAENYRVSFKEEQEEETPGYDDPEGAARYQFNLIKDRTGKIPAHIREQELQQARDIYAVQLREARAASNTFQSMGPDNMGGRTRCVAYDVRYNGTSNRVLMAGGVSGGVYKSIDNGATWVRKSPVSAIYNVTCLAQDPRPGHQDTWYYGTGEVLGGYIDWAAPPNGDGVFKSTDNGESWQRLPQSNTGIYEEVDRNADFIWRILVNPVNGDVYMAASEVIYRSKNGGDTWQPVLYSPSSAFLNAICSTDIVVTPSGRLYAAVSGYAPGDLDGVWTSASGDAGAWTRIAGEGHGGSPTGWNAEGYNDDYGYGRIVLAMAACNPDILYAFMQTMDNTCPNNAITYHRTPRLFRYHHGSWTDLTNSLPGCAPINAAEIAFQGGYDMAIAVKPDDPNTVFLGGTNLYRSTDGFANTAANLQQVGGYGFAELHPDIHWLAFNPVNAAEMICANDGGMQRTTNVMQPAIDWISLNHFYQTLQFYYVSLSPGTGSDKIIGGTQDNGSNRNVGGAGSVYQQITYGDGFSTAISKPTNGKQYEYTSAQYSALYRRDADWPPESIESITPYQTAGYPVSWVTVFKLDDDNTEFLYLANFDRIFRTTAASACNTNSWTELTNVNTQTRNTNAAITAMATSRGQYNSNSSALFFGNWYGQVFRLDDPAFCPADKLPVDITKDLPETWGYITSIAVNPRNDDTVLITKSNYGATGIWWTGNAHAASPTWVNVERNLSLPSIRSAAIAITPSGVEYFVGTSVGLFRSSNPASLDWTQESPNEIGNAVVSSLVIRPADNRMIAGTFGHGIWMTTLESAALPLTLLDFSGRSVDQGNLLSWTTNGEYNMEGFDVQRSVDGINFQKIGWMATGFNSSTVKTYQFIDPHPAMRNNYYRLRMVSKEGSYTLSKVIVVKIETMLQEVYVANPFSSQVKIQFAKTPAGKIDAYLFDMSGRLIDHQRIAATQSASLQFTQAGLPLPAGNYVLQIKVDGKSFVRKLVRD